MHVRRGKVPIRGIDDRRESTLDETRNEIREGKLALIRPVITSRMGAVSPVPVDADARAICARRGSILDLVSETIIRSANSSMIMTYRQRVLRIAVLVKVGTGSASRTSVFKSVNISNSPAGKLFITLSISDTAHLSESRHVRSVIIVWQDGECRHKDQVRDALGHHDEFDLIWPGFVEDRHDQRIDPTDLPAPVAPAIRRWGIFEGP